MLRLQTTKEKLQYRQVVMCCVSSYYNAFCDSLATRVLLLLLV